MRVNPLPFFHPYQFSLVCKPTRCRLHPLLANATSTVPNPLKQRDASNGTVGLVQTFEDQLFRYSVGLSD